MSKPELIAIAGFAVLLLLHVTQTEACPPACSCRSVGGTTGLHVDCSSKALTEVPALPADTRRLYLQNNSLTSVPPGALDSLHSLEEVKMFDNPWNCDCRILYLKLWLEVVSVPSLANTRCATPVLLRMKPLGQLSGNEMGVCKRHHPIKCLEFFWRDLILIVGAIIALILIAWALKFSKKLVSQINFSPYDSRSCLLGRRASINHKAQ